MRVSKRPGNETKQYGIGILLYGHAGTVSVITADGRVIVVSGGGLVRQTNMNILLLKLRTFVTKYTQDVALMHS